MGWGVEGIGMRWEKVHKEPMGGNRNLWPRLNCDNFPLAACSTACLASQISSPWSWRRQPSRTTLSQSSSPSITWLRVLMMQRRKWGEVVTKVGQKLLGLPDVVWCHWSMGSCPGEWTPMLIATVCSRQSLPTLVPFHFLLGRGSLVGSHFTDYCLDMLTPADNSATGSLL